MIFNVITRRLIALFACICLAVSGTSVAWAQADSKADSKADLESGAGASSDAISFGSLDTGDDIRLFLAQADTGDLGFDITAPSIAHTPSITAGTAGEVQTIVAEINDNQSVAKAELIYRNSSDDFYTTTAMSADVTNSTWLATIDTTPEDTIVNYYIVAEDADGNRVQKGSESNPLTLELETPQIFSTVTPISKDNRRTWVAVGLGVFVVGALLAVSAAGGGGSGDNDGIMASDGDNNCCSVTFIVPSVTGQ